MEQFPSPFLFLKIMPLRKVSSSGDRCRKKFRVAFPPELGGRRQLCHTITNVTHVRANRNKQLLNILIRYTLVSIKGNEGLWNVSLAETLSRNGAP